jgi:hypothetical protein
MELAFKGNRRAYLLMKKGLLLVPQKLASLSSKLRLKTSCEHCEADLEWAGGARWTHFLGAYHREPDMDGGLHDKSFRTKSAIIFMSVWFGISSSTAPNFRGH